MAISKITALVIYPFSEKNRAFAPILDETILHILKKLNLSDLLNCSKVCKHLYHVSNSDSLWKSLFFKKFPNAQIQPNQHFKQTFQEITYFHENMLQGIYVEQRFKKPAINMSQLIQDGKMAVGSTGLTEGKLIIFDLTKNTQFTFIFDKESYSLKHIFELSKKILAVTFEALDYENPATGESIFKYKLKFVDIEKQKIVFSKDCNTVDFLKNNRFLISYQLTEGCKFEIYHENLEEAFLFKTSKRIKFASELTQNRIVTITSDDELDILDRQTGTSVIKGELLSVQFFNKLSDGNLVFYSKLEKTSAKDTFYCMGNGSVQETRYPGFIYDPKTNTITRELDLKKFAEFNTLLTINIESRKIEWVDTSGLLSAQTNNDLNVLFWNLKTQKVPSLIFKGEHINVVRFPALNEAVVMTTSNIYHLNFNPDYYFLLSQIANELFKITQIKKIIELNAPCYLINENKEKITFLQIMEMLIRHPYLELDKDDRNVKNIGIDLLTDWENEQNYGKAHGLGINIMSLDQDHFKNSYHRLFFIPPADPQLVNLVLEITKFEEVNFDLIRRFSLLPTDILEGIYKELPKERFCHPKLATDLERLQAIENYLIKKGYKKPMPSPLVKVDIYESTQSSSLLGG